MKKCLLFLLPMLFLFGCSVNNQATETISITQDTSGENITIETTEQITGIETSLVNDQNILSLDNIALQHESRSFGKTDPFNGPKQWALGVPVQIYIKNNSNKIYSYGPIGQDSSIVVKCGNNDLYSYQVEGYEVSIAPNGIFDTSKWQGYSSSSDRMNFDCERIFGFTNTDIQNPSLIFPSIGSKSVDINCGLYLYSLNNDGSYKEHKISTLKVKTDIYYTVSGNELICELK